MQKSLIIITTVGKHEKIFDNIKYIFKKNSGNFKIALAYNGPKDNRRFFESMNRQFPAVDIVKSEIMCNIPIAITNVVKKHKNYDFYFIVDDDVIVFEKRWIEKATDILSEHKQIGVLGIVEDKYIDRSVGELGYVDGNIKICDWSTTVMGTRKEVMEKCHFDAKNFPLGFYDADWETNARSKGYLIACKRMKCVHIGGQSSNWVYFNNKKALEEFLKNREKKEIFYKKYKHVLRKSYWEHIQKESNLDERKFLRQWSLSNRKNLVLSSIKLFLMKLIER
ncbi:MAG: hypothetical protein HYY37_01690 [Candidatus Aenigmarchaeota archaeon]|nr:hypothetical protein [Candidatus Aenigmarchaeota archaeon]